MASRLGNTFIYTEQYYNTINKLDENIKYKVNWDLCYYGTHEGQLPEDASPISQAIITAFEILIDDSSRFVEKQADLGKKGGRPSQISDEQIKGAILQLYKDTGRIPGEKAVLEFVGGTASIRKREPWINRAIICGECGEQEKNETPKTNSSFNF